MKTRFVFFGLLALLIASCARTENDIEKHIEGYLAQMTLEEKVGILHAQSKFSSAGVPRYP